MSAFYDLASLVVVPSGYKASKVYAQKPLTTDGQLAFTRSTTATRVNSAGLIEASAVNVPRLDYLGSSCPRLLLEPQRTNLYNYSEQLNQWTASSATVTANYAVSPDGYTNADRVQFSAGGLLYVSATGSAGENTLSVYAKATNGTSAKFRFFGNGNTTNSSDQTATGEWQRFTFTYTFSASTAGLKVATTGADDIIFYGFQHEIGSYATSYIPTLGAAVTRGEDAASKTGISSLIGQTEGTLFADFFYIGNTQAEIIDVSDGTENNRIMFYVNAGSQAQVYVTNGGSSDGFIASSFNVVAGTEYKIAIGYKVNDLVLYINGTQIGTDTSLAIPATSKLTISNGGAGNYPMASRVAQVLLFKTRLTNAQLAELTTI